MSGSSIRVGLFAQCALLLAGVLAVALALAVLPQRAQPVLFHDHGHGLAFSSDGKALLAPSHFGLAGFEDGAWWEMPGPAQGFSGFAVAERAIYASGHSRPGVPSPHEPVGLVRSLDGGKTWAPLAPALVGKADFRLLAAGYRSNVIYVVNARANPVMPASGLYVTHDEGRTWRRAQMRGLEGEIHGIAVHPLQGATVAIATGRGLHLSRDTGESFRRLDGREPVTAVGFDFDGKRLRYARALSNEVIEAVLEGRQRRTLRLPPLGLDYVTCLAQNSMDGQVLAFATRRRDLYMTLDGGRSWRKLAEAGESAAPVTSDR